MDCQHEDGIEGAVCIKSSQIGLSEVLVNDIAFTIDWKPSPMLLVQPTKELSEEFAKDRIQPLIKHNPRIRRKITDSTLTNYRFDRGFLAIGSANTPRSLAGKPIRKVYLDEVDGYPASSGIEGDPVELARARVKTFKGSRFTWMFSTPTIKKLSRIEREWEKSDQRRFFVPCHCCGQIQYLKWANVRFTNHDSSTSRYQCENPACKGTPWTQTELNENVQKGIWIATKPENRKNGLAGFHIWEIYSPWSSMREIVQKFLDCKNIPDQLRVWKNTCLGECDEIEGEGVDQETIRNRVELYGGWEPENPRKRPTIKNEVLLLVSSVDVQKDRLELFVGGFGLDEELWSVEHVIFPGDPLKGEVWDRLDAHLLAEYKREDGVPIKISTCFVDSADKTQNVYAFTKPRQNRGVYSVKGSSFPNKTIVARARRLGPRKVAVHEIGTDTAKDLIMARVAMDPTKRDDGSCPGYIHFPKGFGFDYEYFEQLTAEKYTIKHRNGVPFRVWVNIRPNKRNEALDLMVYAYAAFFNMRADMARLSRKLEQKRQTATPSEKQDQPKSEGEATPEATEESKESNEPTPQQPKQEEPKTRKAMRRRSGSFVTGWRKY